MKKHFQSLSFGWLIVFSILFAGCTFTIYHKFDQPPVVVNNYYTGGGEAGSGMPGLSVNNNLSTEFLGIGYDIVRVDPEDWAANSIESRGVAPRIFEFPLSKDNNRVIDIPRMDETIIRRIKPEGVNASAGPKFDWEDQVTLVSNYEDFQETHGGFIEAGGGAYGVAFSASASFDNAYQKTTEDEKMLGYKKGAYRGIEMEIDFAIPQNLNPLFVQAVKALGTDPAAYDAFILNWGTHFSKDATIGARCAYEMEFTKSALSTRSESASEFKASVSGSFAGVSAEVGGGANQSVAEAAKNETGAENVLFVSYGGSGAGMDDFATWSRDAVNNSTVIDVNLLPYDTLFSTTFFPDDASEIASKKVLMKEALARYYALARQKMQKDLKPDVPVSFQQDVEFTVELRKYILQESVDEKKEFWGNLTIDLFDAGEVSQALLMPSLTVFKLSKSNPEFYPRGEEFNIVEEINNLNTVSNNLLLPAALRKIMKQRADELKAGRIRKFAISADLVDSYFLSLTGKLFCYWCGGGQDEGLSKLYSRADDKNSVQLASVRKGTPIVRDVSMVYEDGATTKYNFVVTYVVTRLN